MENTKNKIPDFKKLGKELIRDTVHHASGHSKNFFKEAFQKEGWTDTAFEAWPSRSSPDPRPDHAILIMTAHLRDSIELLHKSYTKLTFGTTAPYAQIHNEGGTFPVPVTEKSRKFFWYMYHKTKQDHWKWMALTEKKQFTIKIPKRQFIGHSNTLMMELHNWWVAKLEKKFKQL